MSPLRALVDRNLKSALVAVGWGASFAAATLWAIFQGLLLPQQTITPPSIWQTGDLLHAIYFCMVLGIAFLSGLCVGDMGKTIVAFLISYLIGAIIVYEVLFFPGANSVDTAFRESLAMLSISWTFVALFPIPFFIGLFGAIFGAAMEETIVG